jgi:T3SS (YopN, CesT) and YbjN peptide-binding chaperone 1
VRTRVGCRRGTVDAAREASRVTNVEMIRPYVEKKVAEHLGVESVKPGPDGTIPIRVGSTACIVKLLEGPTGPMLRVYSPFLQEVDTTPALLEELNDLNARAPYVRFFWFDRQVICAADLIATDLETGEIANALEAVAFYADSLDEELEKGFGGKRVFEGSERGATSEDAGTPEGGGKAEGGAKAEGANEAEEARTSDASYL